jgi:E3 ubiquitin-protein ligase HERC4
MCGTFNGSVYPSLTSMTIPKPLLFVQIACGRKHVIAVMEGGFVFSWGMGHFGQLGHGDDASWETPRMIKSLEPKKIGSKALYAVCGGLHSGVVVEDGRVYMWGLNRNGQTGTGAKGEFVLDPKLIDTVEINRRMPKKLICGRNHTCLLTEDGRVYSWGAAGFGRFVHTSVPSQLCINVMYCII